MTARSCRDCDGSDNQPRSSAGGGEADRAAIGGELWIRRLPGDARRVGIQGQSGARLLGLWHASGANMVTALGATLWASAAVASLIALYMLIGLVGFALYRPKAADEEAENVLFSITTIGSESIRPALMEAIDHHLEVFPDYELYVTVDEGADLEAELTADARVTTIVVPDEFTCRAEAKGRAIQYFIESVVADHPDHWVAFIDDDNKILDRQILREIPYYDERGYGAANAVLYPRPGRSTATFVMDHLRTLDDLTVFRAFTGLLGRPYVGFHGELLTARADVLLDVTFDRPSIVEDYAFAARLIERGIPTWQTASRVSILSPHTIHDLFRQRRRWYLGLLQEQLRNPPIATAVMGLRMLAWTLALLGGIASAPLWLLTDGIPVPLGFRVAIAISSAAYLLAYVWGVYRVAGWRRVGHALLIPVYAFLEGATALYSIVRYRGSFVVIEK